MDIQRFVRDESGVAILEFAIMASLLLLLVFGITGFGLALFTQNNLTSAAREAARYGAALPDPESRTADICAKAVANMVKTDAITPTCALVSVSYQRSGGILQSVEVRTKYPFSGLKVVSRLVGQSMRDTLRARATFRWEGS